MYKRVVWSLLYVLLCITTSMAQKENLPAFPGAEGNGKYVTGGRGGRVIYDTTIVDTNSAGS